MGYQDQTTEQTSAQVEAKRRQDTILAAQAAAIKGDMSQVNKLNAANYGAESSFTPDALAKEKYREETTPGNSLNLFKDMVVPGAMLFGGGYLGMEGLMGLGGGAAAGGAMSTADAGTLAGLTEGSAGAVGGDVLGGAGGVGTNAMTGAATAGAADGAGGFLDFINSPDFTGAFDPGAGGMTVGGPGGMAGGAGGMNLPFGLQSKDLAMGGLNFGLNQYLAKQAHQAGQSAANTSNALNQPQRAPFQAAANDMVQNPQDYFKNNPFATSMADFYKNGVIPANIAKSGNTGFETDRLGAQFATAVGGNYNALLQQLQGFGGYNQGTGYSGTNQLQGDMAANQFQGESFRGIGKAAEGIFGSPDQPKTPQQNPITGSYTVIQ